MFVPTSKGVVDLAAVAAPVFGARNMNLLAEDLLLELSPASLESYSGEHIEILGVQVPVTARVAMADRSWKLAGGLAEGDSILRWVEESGALEPYSLPALARTTGEGLRLVAERGALVGPASHGPWILVG